jgi:DUF917 family protein
MVLDEDAIEAMVLGGAFLGGGGGGSLEEGRRFGRAALKLGRPSVIPIDGLPDESLLATVSAVGAPASREKFVQQEDYVKAVNLLAERIGEGLSGLISSENGGLSTVNGLVQSAALSLPVIDAPCNGRAHPTGIMGSMGLGELSGFISRQAAAGGNPETGRHLELYVEAPLPRADALVRQAAVESGGLVAVARNPVDAGYVRKHGAPGAIRMALELGRLMMRERQAGGETVARKLAVAAGGEIVVSGQVAELELETRGGYDVGRLTIEDVELTFWNEYMTLERSGVRLATFPDLISTLDAVDGTPRTSADLEPGTRVIVLRVPRKNLILGAGMRVPAGFRAVEEVLKRQIVSYL